MERKRSAVKNIMMRSSAAVALITASWSASCDLPGDRCWEYTATYDPTPNIPNNTDEFTWGGRQCVSEDSTIKEFCPSERYRVPAFENGKIDERGYLVLGTCQIEVNSS